MMLLYKIEVELTGQKEKNRSERIGRAHAMQSKIGMFLKNIIAPVTISNVVYRKQKGVYAPPIKRSHRSDIRYAE